MLVKETSPHPCLLGSPPWNFQWVSKEWVWIFSGSNGLHIYMIGTAFYPLKQHERNFSKSLTKRKCTFHWNLFVSNRWPSLGRTFHHQTSGFPVESKGIWLESSWQYLTTLLKLGSTATVDSDCTAPPPSHPLLHQLMYQKLNLK